MTTPRPSAAAHPLRRRLLALGAVLAALLVTAVHAAQPAQAAARVSVSSELGGAKASTTAPTTVSLSGNGFQSVQGGFGGIYVLFGSISDGWRPSEGGATGTDYQYVPDSETKDNQGYQRFVTFPGSSTAGAANGGELAADGTWNAEMIIPGPEFDSMDRDGNVTRVNCLEVQCGIITIGAHGVKNANNETFTPIEFVGEVPAAEGEGTSGDDAASGNEEASADAAGSGGDASAEGAAPQQSNSAQAAPAPAAEGSEGSEGSEEADDPAAAAAGEDAADASAETAELGEAQVGLVSKDASQGGALSFTARGFLPGEQVVGTLDNGTSAAGPYQSGASGEIAGSLPIPADLRPGTHVITLTGAASEQTARASFTVTAGAPAGATAQVDEAGSLGAWDIVMIVVLILVGLVLLVLLVAVITSLVRLIARRRAAKRAAAAEQAAEREAERAAAAPGERVWPGPGTDVRGGAAGRRARQGAALGLALLTLGAASAISPWAATRASAEELKQKKEEGAIELGVEIPEETQPSEEAPTPDDESASSLSWRVNDESGGGA